ncbi:MAG: YggS family pyridoxal phosphate-dependent enzyme [Candidatus Zixiibacteriota bacterium]
MTNPVDQITENIRRFRDELHGELARLGRPPDSVVLVAVSKTFGPDAIAAALVAGLTDFGENRIQEAKTKIPLVQTPSPSHWHLVGHLQSNKAKDAVALFDLIQSVDSAELARDLNHRAELIGKRQDILIQVNTTQESQKSGCDPTALDDLVASVAPLPNLRIMGLMTIGPFVDDPAPITRSFQMLRREFDRLAQTDLHGGAMRHCSMGMTDDWRIALAEGSTMLRIGRAIFGERQ